MVIPAGYSQTVKIVRCEIILISPYIYEHHSNIRLSNIARNGTDISP